MNELVKPITFAINHLYRRQTADSKYSHFDGTDQELIDAVNQNFPLRAEGYRQGTYMVPIETIYAGKHRVFTPVVKVDRRNFLNTEAVAHSQKDIPLICASVIARKVPAMFAKVCVYSHDALVKIGDHSSKADYEIVSLMGSDVENQPEHPYELARRVLREGASYTAKEICEAILYWGSHAYAKTKFAMHPNKEIADLIRKGDSNTAIKVRRKQVPEETSDDAAAYVTALYHFMQITNTLSV
jgi:hypothetical protein